ncbi:MAG: hypothetical protein KDA89_16375 [Planctomycetaceae bacterium]|nr:hypothetical protein [Planctomycetaceae bacterium]
MNSSTSECRNPTTQQRGGVLCLLTFCLWAFVSVPGWCDEQPAEPSAAGMSAGDAVRQIRLPVPPHRYESVAPLPPHVQTFAAGYDNTPPDNPITNAGAALGRVLFYDRSLSVNGTISCASCHQQGKAFTDGRATSLGFNGQLGTRNSMSLVNLRYYRSGRMFWDERAATLEDQVLRPIEDPTEMGHRLQNLIPQLQADPLYPPLFCAAFGDDRVTTERTAKALAQFVRSIVSFTSPYDKGRAAVDSVYDDFPNFTAQQNLGKRMFLTRGGCAICHLAPEEFFTHSPRQTPVAATDSVTSPLTPAFDAVLPGRQSAFFFVEGPAVNGIDGDPAVSDPGVGRSSGKDQDHGAFKVSSLRNVEVTGPYMHDGRFTTIDRVLEHYNWSVRPHPNLDPRLQDAVKGIALPEREKTALTEFLHTLTDHNLLTNPIYSDPFVR